VSRRDGEERETPTRNTRLHLRLYVAGDAPNSTQARANLDAICARYLEPGDYDVEIIDVLDEPLRALDDGVLVTPTLLGSISPSITIVGTLDDHERVKRALGLE